MGKVIEASAIMEAGDNCGWDWDDSDSEGRERGTCTLATL